MRVGNYRIRRHLGCPGRQRRFVLRAHLYAAVARFRRGLWNRHGLRGGLRCEAGDGSGDQQRQSATDNAMGELLCHSIFRISVSTRLDPSILDPSIRCPCPPFYRAFGQRRYRFSVKHDVGFRPLAALRIGLLLPRPKSRACRRDSPGRRCLRVPCAPSAKQRGYSRFAAGAECSWSRPCDRV